MAKYKKILILTDALPWGHKSIAKAIYNSFLHYEDEIGYNVELHEIKANTGIVAFLYVLIYRYFPSANSILFSIYKKKFFRNILEKSAILNTPRIVKVLDTYKPDLVISTFFFHSHSLVDLREKEGRKFKIWTIVTDPWTINPMLLVKGADLNIFYDKRGIEEGIRNGLDKVQTVATGWWVNEEMYKVYDSKEARRELGFFDCRPVIFLGGGSLGISYLSKFLPLIISQDKKVGFIINVGSSKFQYKAVVLFQKLLSFIRKKDDTIIIKPFGWIDNMPQILAACDIVFGKAGPNFLFECVACKKPIVAIAHIGGQEDGNLELIKEKNLGLVKERYRDISKFLSEYLDQPEYFKMMFLKDMEMEASNNKKSLQTMLELVKNQLYY